MEFFREQSIQIVSDQVIYIFSNQQILRDLSRCSFSYRINAWPTSCFRSQDHRLFRCRLLSSLLEVLCIDLLMLWFSYSRQIDHLRKALKLYRRSYFSFFLRIIF